MPSSRCYSPTADFNILEILDRLETQPGAQSWRGTHKRRSGRRSLCPHDGAKLRRGVSEQRCGPRREAEGRRAAWATARGPPDQRGANRAERQLPALLREPAPDDGHQHRRGAVPGRFGGLVRDPLLPSQVSRSVRRGVARNQGPRREGHPSPRGHREGDVPHVRRETVASQGESAHVSRAHARGRDRKGGDVDRDVVPAPGGFGQNRGEAEELRAGRDAGARLAGQADVRAHW